MEDDLILLLSSKLSSPSLERIEIAFLLDPAIWDDDAAINWLDIDRHLARMTRDAALSVVIVQADCVKWLVDRHRNKRQELDRIAGRLPELCAAGIRVGIVFHSLYCSFSGWFHRR